MTGTAQRGVAIGAAIVLIAAIGWTVLRPASNYHVTAYFNQAVGLYKGSSVRILGLEVGTIDDVVPEGTRVRVEMSIDKKYPVPANAEAVILAPSLVSDRYVQFAPVYNGGPRMQDGAVVPLKRTATPVELDQVYSALDDLSDALGPNGANKKGALSDLVDVGAKNLDGNGQQFNETLSGFSQAVRTLADNRNDLFSSLDNLQTFTSALASIDAQVRQFNDNMAAVANQLAGERQDLSSAIHLLQQALGQVATFVRDNTDLLTTNVNRLADVTLTLVRQRDALAQVMDVAPAALSNLSHAYNPDFGTLDTRDNSAGSLNAEVVVCQVLQATGNITIPSQLTVPDLIALPPVSGICARILSGDLNGDGKPDDLNGNGIPDLQEIEQALNGGGGGGGNPIGFPPVGGQG